MQSRTSETIPEKLNEISEIILKPESLSSVSEGSKVIVMIVAPKEEAKAVENLKQRFERKLHLINTGELLVDTARQYGVTTLEEDFDFIGKSALRSFSQKLLDRINKEIIDSSKENEITAIHRLGVLNGFFGLNPIIEAVAGQLANPVLVIYPGKRKDKILTFLDGRHSTSIYRAKIV